jgi:hypothetical protein
MRPGQAECVARLWARDHHVAVAYYRDLLTRDRFADADCDDFLRALRLKNCNSKCVVDHDAFQPRQFIVERPQTASGCSGSGRRLEANDGRDKTDLASTAVGPVSAALLCCCVATFSICGCGSASAAEPATSYPASAATVSAKIAAEP